ncbi:glycosyltransferase [Paracoccaceae bacterium]|nr:glycosyltransferase [Paracoccaceae bacterium]
MKSVEITLPVLNEEVCLEKSVKQVIHFLNTHSLSNWSLVIADNGSTDQTLDLAEKLATEFPDQVRVISVSIKGVGAAVRAGWTSSKASIVGYMDIDLATSISHLIDVQNLFTKSTETKIVNGSRRLPNSIVENRKWVRRITSYSLNKLLAVILGVRFTDAMCGFKFFEREVALDLLRDIPRIPDWFVCAELLIRAEWKQHAVSEIPVVWTDDPVSRVKIFKLSNQYIKHILRLFIEKRNSSRL